MLPGAHRRDDVFDVVERRVGARGNQHVEISEARDLREIAQHVVGQRLEQRHADGVVISGERQRVAIGQRGYARLRGHDPAGPRPVLDDELLTQLFAQALRNDAGGDVGDATRPVRNEDAHRPVRIAGLRVRRHWREECGQPEHDDADAHRRPSLVASTALRE